MIPSLSFSSLLSKSLLSLWFIYPTVHFFRHQKSVYARLGSKCFPSHWSSSRVLSLKGLYLIPLVYTSFQLITNPSSEIHPALSVSIHCCHNLSYNHPSPGHCNSLLAYLCKDWQPPKTRSFHCSQSEFLKTHEIIYLISTNFTSPPLHPPWRKPFMAFCSFAWIPKSLT